MLLVKHSNLIHFIVTMNLLITMQADLFDLNVSIKILERSASELQTFFVEYQESITHAKEQKPFTTDTVNFTIHDTSVSDVFSIFIYDTSK